MDTGREPSAPTRRAPRPPAHASPLPLILARTSLAFADSVEVFLGGTGQESTPDHYPAAHRAPNPGQGLFPPRVPSIRAHPGSPTPRSRPHPLLPVPPSPPPCLPGPPKSPPQAPAADGSASPARPGSPEKRASEGGGVKGGTFFSFSQRIPKAGSGVPGRGGVGGEHCWKVGGPWSGVGQKEPRHDRERSAGVNK